MIGITACYDGALMSRLCYVFFFSKQIRRSGVCTSPDITSVRPGKY